jgi:Kef-type K+ transport system membrane component KefB
VFCVFKMTGHQKEELKQINVMVVLLLMCCLRLYHTFQNAFHVFLVVIFAIRTSCKVLLVMILNSDPMQSTNKLLSCNVSLAYDVLTLYLLLFCLNFTTESAFDNQLMNSSILLIGLQLGTVVAFINKCRCQ